MQSTPISTALVKRQVGITQVLRFIWVSVIFAIIIGSLLPGTSTPMKMLESFHLSDKVQHFLAYTVLAFLPSIHEKRRFTLWAASGAILLGVALEYGQLLVSSRSSDVIDIVMDTGGVMVGLVLGDAVRLIPSVRAFLPRSL